MVLGSWEWFVVGQEPKTRSLAEKKQQHQTTFKRQGMFISKLFYSLIDFLRSKAKIRISCKILKMSLLILPPT